MSEKKKGRPREEKELQKGRRNEAYDELIELKTNTHARNPKRRRATRWEFGKYKIGPRNG